MTAVFDARPVDAAKLLARVAAAAPDRAALVTPGEQIRWARLSVEARRTAAALRRSGVARGDLVAIWLPNGVDWLTAYWGCLVGGFRPLPLGTRSPVGEIADLLERFATSVLLSTTTSPLVPMTELAPRLSAVPGLRAVLVRTGDREPSLPPPLRCWDQTSGDQPEDSASDPDPCAIEIGVVQLTSGSTGPSKAALLPAAGLLAAAGQHASAWRLAAGDAVFVPNPFSHVLGLVYGVLMPAAAGLTCVTSASFEVEEALRLIAEQRVVAMTGAPTHFQMLADALAPGERSAPAGTPPAHGLDLSALRVGLTGGAGLSSEWANTIRRRLGLDTLVNGYGMSEVGSIAQTGLDDPVGVAASSVGRPMPWLETRIVDPGSSKPVATGAVGELWVRGPSVMKGYAGQPELDAVKLRPDGWLRTGDLLRADECGRLELVGRLDDQFTVGGFNVHPAEIEKTLETHPDVSVAHVIGERDERLGTVPIAFVQSNRTEIEPDELISYCRERLRSYAVPRRVIRVEGFPLNTSGKVDRERLRQMAETTTDRE